MNTRMVLPVVMTLGIAGVFSQSIGSQAQAAESFKVDSVHSTVFFRVKHMRTEKVSGRILGIPQIILTPLFLHLCFCFVSATFVSA